MRTVIDLQACQTETSKDRGVGRYSLALAQAIARHSPADSDVRVCLNARLDRLGSLAAQLGRGVGQQRVSTYEYPDLDRASGSRLAASTGVAEALVAHHWIRLQPDVLHVSHVFEGYPGDAVVPRALPAVPGVLRSATLYDLIPLRFPEQYFAEPAFKRWYLRRVATLRTCDLLLAISESTRRDAIELLGIAPSRVATIYGGIDDRFTPAVIAPEDARGFRRRFGLRGRFVLYTGGDEYRKNLRGAIAGYAEVPAPVRRDRQLVIVCALSDATRSDLLEHARRLGVVRDELVLPGYVSGDDLLCFYRLCDAFVFPSRYEGLGLPVLEAMKCGAPVIGAATAGIGEVIGRPDALFDPDRPAALAERLVQALTDEGFRDDLRSHGALRAREFTWERTATAARDAWTETRRRGRPATTTLLAANLVRRRLAVFTPLPPCRTGIADYNFAFLPFLARYFDIDVYVDARVISSIAPLEAVTVHPDHEFPSQSTRYDAVVYDVGNSEFHAYMLDYLERHPGIVVLHDAYLGGLYGYVDFTLGRTGCFAGEMLHAHGPRARRYLAPSAKRVNAIRDAMVHLPATRSIIGSAIGIISHSPFNRDVASASYPEGFATPYRIVPQMVQVPLPIDDAARHALRLSRGFGADDFLVCTFGHVVWTKCGDQLFDAFTRSKLASVANTRLVYVGELAKDPFGDSLQRSISSVRPVGRVTVTGYLDETSYRECLRIADVAVQLRVHSRGGTPKGVLDCLAFGVPVVVNNDASYRDYPDEVVWKLPPEPSAAALIELFDTLAATPGCLTRHATRGREYVERVHAPEEIAARFAMTIDELAQRGRAASLWTAVRGLGRAVNHDEPTLEDRAAEAGARLHAELLRDPFVRRRVLVDISHLTSGDHRTGIQRVVRSVVGSLYRSDRAGFDPVAVRLDGARLVEAREWLAGEGLLLDGERSTAQAEVVPRWGDCLLMLDSSWERYAKFAPTFDAVRRAQGTIWTAVYDLLPIRFPQHWPDGASAWFEDWLRKAIAASDGLVCISRAVADELDGYIARHPESARTPKRLAYWHLGSDGLDSANAKHSASDRVAAATSAARTLLMVGTLEPRKNHSLAISAMELLWQDGSDLQLCIAGKQGWLVEALIERIRKHPELGRRLHYIEQPTDEELAHCYRRCAALLAPSAGEGFGLPLVEAARFGTPIIASDLPVFREIAGEHATYFALGDANTLADALRGCYATIAAGSHLAPGMPPTLTWEESAERLLDVVLEDRWYKLAGGTRPPDDRTR